MAKGSFRRWMYRGQHPNWRARTRKRVDVALSGLGFVSNYEMAALEVTGRTSGRTISLPIAIAAVNGQRYLVSMLGENVQWVKNVRAAGGRAVIRSGRREEVRLEETPVDQRAPIIKAYLQRAPGARAHMPVDMHAPLADFEKIAGAYPVFHIVARTRD